MEERNIFYFVFPSLGVLYSSYNNTFFPWRNGITERNMLCSQQDFYATKSYTKLYIYIYMCPMQRKYNTFLHNKQSENQTKWEAYVL